MCKNKRCVLTRPRRTRRKRNLLERELIPQALTLPSFGAVLLVRARRRTQRSVNTVHLSQHFELCSPTRNGLSQICSVMSHKHPPAVAKPKLSMHATVLSDNRWGSFKLCKLVGWCDKLQPLSVSLNVGIIPRLGESPPIWLVFSSFALFFWLSALLSSILWRQVRPLS